MKELKQLFIEAYKEAKHNPLEALGTLVAFIAMCGMCYIMFVICWVVGG